MRGEGSPVHGAWRCNGRFFPSCAELWRNALSDFRAAHCGQDDSAVRWAGGVENVKKLILQGT